MRELRRPLFAAASALLLCCATLGIAYATGMLAGGHMYAFQLPFKLSFAFAAVVGIVAGIFSYRNRRDHSPFLAAVTGAASGCLYWYFSERVMAMRFTGRWQWRFLSLDYELQAALCWVAAGAAAMMVVFGRRTTAVLSTAAILCLLAAFLPALIFNHLTDNQELTIALVTPTAPGAGAVRPEVLIGDGGSNQFDAAKATALVLEKLRLSGLQGEYRVTNLYRIGQGRKSLEVVVVSAPVANRALLPEPKGSELIYVQKPSGWDSIPSKAPVLDRSIEIWGPGKSADSLAYFGISDASGISLTGRIRLN